MTGTVKWIRLIQVTTSGRSGSLNSSIRRAWLTNLKRWSTGLLIWWVERLFLTKKWLMVRRNAVAMMFTGCQWSNGASKSRPMRTGWLMTWTILIGQKTSKSNNVTGLAAQLAHPFVSRLLVNLTIPRLKCSQRGQTRCLAQVTWSWHLNTT